MPRSCPLLRTRAGFLVGVFMPKGLRRRYGQGHLHFITCSRYRRLPLFASVRSKNLFVKILGEVRDRYGFSLLGYVVMPEHIHLLISEPAKGTPSILFRGLLIGEGHELVSETSNRYQVAWLGGFILNISAQTHDEIIDSASVGILA